MARERGGGGAMIGPAAPAGAAGRAVLVTGASSGLGLETSVALAERGFRVYASMRDPARRGALDREAARRGVRASVVRLDVTREEEIGAAVDTIVRECGGIYGLVNNAGVVLRGFFEDASPEEIRTVFETNVFGTMAVTRAVLPHMRAAGTGRVVIVSSIGGRIGSLSVDAYCASKFALEGFGESLWMELLPFNVRVSLVEPPIVKTPYWGANRWIAAGAMDERSPYRRWFENAERLADRLVRSSPSRPADVASAICRALTARRPRLRYVVGRRAAVVLFLRKYLPGESFERLYFGEAIRRVTRPQKEKRQS